MSPLYPIGLTLFLTYLLLYWVADIQTWPVLVLGFVSIVVMAASIVVNLRATRQMRRERRHW